MCGIFTSFGDYWNCDETRYDKQTLFRVEAAIYALERMRESEGRNFGAVIINTCYKETRTVTQILDILSGQKKIEWNGQVLDPSKVVAIIGDYSSGVTKQVGLLCYPLVYNIS